jgi:IS5 family transposase
MSRQRFRETGKGSFFGDFVYDRAVPRGHFFRRLNEVVDWEGLSQKLIGYYKGGGKYGPPPYEPSLLLKMLLVSYLYGLSERQTEEVANDSLSVKCFLGLGVDEPAPDHSTLTVFKERLLEGGGEEAYEELFREVLGVAREKGIEFGKVQVVDSTHTVADVNVRKNERRGKGEKRPRDPQARWGGKGKKGRKHFFYGYKQHLSLNAATELITAVVHTPGNASDGKYLGRLMEKDEIVGIEAGVYAADKGYDDGENHLLLWEKGKKSALCLKRYRTEKKDRNKRIWYELKADPDYQMGLAERYKVEQKFGEGKTRHGLRRCRYLGLLKYGMQGYLTAMALNLKRIVKLLFGVSFRNQAYQMAGTG